MSVIAPASFAVPSTLYGEGACGDVIELRPLNVNEATSSTAVNEGLCASLDRGIRRLNLYIHCEGHQSWACCYNKFDG
jgi:hypothetical protein